ncbi:MAG: hypothetical protein ACJ0G6_04635 [Candidatus Pseudothioglobus sp.]
MRKYGLKPQYDIDVIKPLDQISRWNLDNEHQIGTAILVDFEGKPGHIRQSAFIGISYSKWDGRFFDKLFEFTDVHKKDNYEVEAIVDLADLMISHNAEFDRTIFDLRFPMFNDKPWGCSLTNINWKQYGFRHQSLGFLLKEYGWKFNEHNALEDTRALAQLLSEKLPSGEYAMYELLINSRQPKTRVLAAFAPHKANEEFKSKGYMFNSKYILSPSKNGVWFKDVDPKNADKEIKWLKDKYNINPLTMEITAKKNFTPASIYGISA